MTHSATYTLSGLSCASCVSRAENALVSVPGVTEARVNLATHTARVVFDAPASDRDLRAALERAGYAAVEGDTSARSDETRDYRAAFILAALLSLPVVILEMGGHLVPAFHHWLMAHVGQGTLHLVQFALTTAVLAGPGRVFFTRGFAALAKGAPDMNALVALGTGAAWAYSTTVTFAPALLPAAARSVYFEPAAVIVTLILAGRWMEGRAAGRAGAAIRSLLELAPATAIRRTCCGKESEVPLSDVRPGDTLIVRPGARIPTDGVIREGRSEIDEAMLTGEPLPVARGPGDAITGGTINGTAALVMEATAVGADTALARIAATVEEAQGSRLPIQSLIDRVTAVFVPAILAIAVLTLAAWLIAGAGLDTALIAAVAVLIVACPCAMGLATPMSILTGTGRAAQLGVLFRRGEAVQRMAGVRVVAFDKTGTLTQGRPRVSRVETAPGWQEAEVMRLAAAAEAQSEHPIARAIAAAYDGPLPPVRDMRAEVGAGLSARVEGRRVLIGTAAFLNEAGVDAATLDTEPPAPGETPVYIAIDGQPAARLGIADTLREGAAETVAALHRRGIATVMLTGDTEGAARSIGEALGIADIRAGLKPEDKRAAIDALRARYGPVAVVGDGINDAPALAAADVGLAIGTGTDIAIEAADAVSMAGDPRRVVTAHDMSRATMRNIRQNLFWAFAYNTALIPVAAGLLAAFGGPMLSPMLAGGAMALSSLCVVANALRLSRARVTL